jgi:hypothetical protein
MPAADNFDVRAVGRRRASFDLACSRHPNPARTTNQPLGLLGLGALVRTTKPHEVETFRPDAWKCKAVGAARAAI